MMVIILKDLEAKIESYGMLRFLGISMFIFFLLFLIVAPGFQRVLGSFIPNLILVVGIGEFLIFLIFTILSTIGNTLSEDERTVRDLALGSDFSPSNIIIGKYTSFILHLVLFLILTLPINLVSLNLSPKGDIMAIYLPILVVNGSLGSWGLFISTMKDKRFAILNLSILLISLLVFTVRLPYPWRLINPILLMINYYPLALLYYLLILIPGLALTFWRIKYLKRVKDETRDG
jgi:hypothetical protein